MLRKLVAINFVYFNKHFFIFILCLHPGAGIYVTTSRLSYSSPSLPNNSIILTSTYRYSYYSREHRMGFYCCSNSTSAGTDGTFIGLNNIAYSGRISNSRESSSSSNAGCMYLYIDKQRYSTSYSYQNYLEASEQGIYTCHMPDTTGRNIDVSVGIYRESYSGKEEILLILVQYPHVLPLNSHAHPYVPHMCTQTPHTYTHTHTHTRTYTHMHTCAHKHIHTSNTHYHTSHTHKITAAPTVVSFQHVRSATKFTLTCISKNSPATDVTWTRDGYTLLIDGMKSHFFQTVTSRRSSTYQNTLVLDDSIENIIGIYACSVTNKFGNYKRNLTVRGKITMVIGVSKLVCIPMHSIMQSIVGTRYVMMNNEVETIVK